MENLQKDIPTEENNINSQSIQDKISIHIDASIGQLRKLMKKYLSEINTMDKADKLSYWLEDYTRCLSFEDKFDPTYLKSYKRGDIVKVNLGYNIGNEEGGLHYCAVIDRNNNRNSGILTVIPLTSFKEKEIHYTSVFLGDEIYKNFKEKYDSLMLKFSSKINSVNPSTSNQEVISLLDDLAFIQKMDSEMSKMKKGSIALVSQITTISKQRIYDPKKSHDILAGLRLSDESLDLINNKIKQLYVK